MESLLVKYLSGHIDPSILILCIFVFKHHMKISKLEWTCNNRKNLCPVEDEK